MATFVAIWFCGRLMKSGDAPAFVPFIFGPDATGKMPNLKRHFDGINVRPAAQRAQALKGKLVFKTEMDEDARKQLFLQNARLAK